MRNFRLSLPKWTSWALLIALTAGVVGGFWALIRERDNARNMIESVYEKSFYDLVLDVNDIEVKLDKLSVSSSSSYQKELLDDVGERATLANANLAQLSAKEGALQGTTRYVNQVGDFAKSLSKKIDKGGVLSAKDKESLRELYEISVEVGQKLRKMRDRLGEGYGFVENMDDINADFGEIDEISVDYPELIYDGPFSDAVVNKEPKGLKGMDITPEQGLEIAKKGLSGLGEVEFLGEWSGKLNTLNYATSDNKGMVKLAKNGQLLMFSTPSREVSVEDMVVSEEDCVKIAYEYLYNNGFEGLTPVWYSNYYGNVFVNFVHEEGGVICYNDMIKVKVSGESGKVVGFEGLAYAYNHIDRVIDTPSISEEEARAKVGGQINIETIRLALIPIDQSEVLSYEIFGTKGDKKYFFYVDARTGEELNILCVIDSEQGDLLM